MIKVNNFIQEAYDGKRRLTKWENIKRVVIHRVRFAEDKNSIFGPIADEDLTGLLVASRFREQSEYTAGSYTGGQQPYQIFTRRDGQTDQLAQLTDVSPHAKRFSKDSIGWAFCGDFRSDILTDNQASAFHDLGILFNDMGWEIVTHDSLPGVGSKICPGGLFGFHDKLGEIKRFCADTPVRVEAAKAVLEGIGIVL